MDERIDIEVIDKVAKSIKPELLGIGQAAKNAYTQIAKLKKELGVTGGSGIASATKAAASAERDATRASAERARQASTTARAIDAERVAMDRLRATAARASVSGVRAGSGANLGVAAGSRSTMAAQTAIMRQTSVANREVAATAKEAAVAQNTFTTSTAKAGQQAGLARHHLLNLGFQLQDIFVSLANGQKPMTVFIQQGGQIGQIAAQSGVGIGGMAKAASGLLLRFAPLALIVGGVASAFALFNHQINKDNDMKKFASTLGLTAKEIKKLEDVTVTWGDTATAIFQVGVQRIAQQLGIDTKNIAKTWNDMLSGMWSITKEILAGIYASFTGVAYSIAQGIKNAGKGDFNPFIAIKEGYAKARKDAMDFIADVEKQSVKNAQGRLRKQATDIIGNRGPGVKAGKSEAERLAERQVEALRKLMEELNKEQAMLARNLVGIDATIAERMNSIADSLESVKIDLYAKQYDELRKKIEGMVGANERQKESLAALSAIYQSAVQPANDWVIAQEQAALALKLWGQEEAQANLINKWLAEQKEAYLDATNPMRQYNKIMADQRALLKFHGKELEVQTEIQRRYNEMKAADPSLNPDKAAIGNDVRSDMKRAGVQSFLGDIDSAANDNFREGGNQWIIDNYKALYEELDRMRNGDLSKEEEVARSKAELDKRYLNARLQNTQSVLSSLASLQDSHVKEVAAIGKAAAVAQATIDGIKAVQAALAGPPGPPWSYAIAATTGIAAAANVARIMGVGFQKGGYTGDVPAHQAVGAVHGREYVMDAASTARIGVPTLEAMRNGRLNPGPAANNNAPRVTVINNAGAAIEVRERSDGELEVLVESALERRMGPAMERRLANPNSRESRAIGNNFKVRRNR